MPTWLIVLIVASIFAAIAACFFVLWRLWPKGDDDDLYAGAFDATAEDPENEARRRQI